VKIRAPDRIYAPYGFADSAGTIKIGPFAGTIEFTNPTGRSHAAMGLEPSGRPLQASSRFDVGSVTKTFVAALVLALVDDGELGLDDDARAYLSTRFEPIGSITVRSLLNHTSGFPDFFEDAAFAARWQESPGRMWNPDELIEVSLALPRPARRRPPLQLHPNCCRADLARPRDGVPRAA
jgi:hypothetical protein